MGRGGALVVVIVYGSEFQHETLDETYSRRHSMRPENRSTERVDLVRLTAHLRAVNHEDFRHLTSHQDDVVHLAHVHHVNNLGHPYVDYLLIGSRGRTERSERDTLPLAEVLQEVIERETTDTPGAEDGTVRPVRVRCAAVDLDPWLLADAAGGSTARTDEIRRSRETVHEHLLALVDDRAGRIDLTGREPEQPGEAIARQWETCYVSVKGPAAGWLDEVLTPALPDPIPIHRLERSGATRGLITTPHPRQRLSDLRTVDRLIEACSYAEAFDLANLEAQVRAEAEALLVEGGHQARDVKRLQNLT